MAKIDGGNRVARSVVGRRTGSWQETLLWSFFLAILMVSFLTAQGCSFYASLSGKRSYVPPDVAARSISKEKGHVVMLVTGTLVVGDFFDVMKQRLEERGLQTVVYQPPDLLTGPLETGARRIGQAVETVCAVSGVDRITIVAECNGGVAACYYVDKLGGAAKVDKLITIVSAHSGAHFVKWINPCPAIRDSRPDSDYMRSVRDLGRPEGRPPLISIYLCSDEIVQPPSTAVVEGAMNIEVCDDGFVRRARDRKPHDVNNLAGWFMARIYPVHLGVFWDEPFFDLLLSCIKDDPATLRKFDRLKLNFH